MCSRGRDRDRGSASRSLVVLAAKGVARERRVGDVTLRREGGSLTRSFARSLRAAGLTSAIMQINVN